MTNQLNKWTSIAAMALLVFGTACGSEKVESGEEDALDVVATVEEGPHSEAAIEEVGAELPAFLNDYIALKEALYAGDFTTAGAAVADLQASISEAGLEEAQLSELKSAVERVAVAEDLQSLRVAFLPLSQELYELVTTEDMVAETLYWQHCPMAMDGEGANWLALEEQINNPYYGDKMPHCGRVAEVIE